MEGPEFLKEKYGNLHSSEEVASATDRKEVRRGEKISRKPLDQIQNYLERLAEIPNRKDSESRGRGIQAVKKVLLSKFVTKFEDIPESYHLLNERIIRERGQGGDYGHFTPEQKDKARRFQAEASLADQESSLEQWIDELTSEETVAIPDYLKYWVFRNVLELQEYDKEKGEFPKRSKGTVKMFPEVNHEALEYVVDAVIKKHKAEEVTFEGFEADLTTEQKEKFLKLLNSENFSKLYAWAHQEIHPIPEHLLLVTDGEWIKYEQDDEETENYKRLSQSIRGRGTGWCTAGENTAKNQLMVGDFYCYYSLDDEKKPTIPRLAIRMEQGKIAEVRGIAAKQNTDPYIGSVLHKKLEEFPDREEYAQKEHDMARLNGIEPKTRKGQDLSPEDLRFLYEIDAPIVGFGQERDIRIKEILSKRNAREDAPLALGCRPYEIAWDRKEIDEDTKAYIGPLFPHIFDYDIKCLYTKFPEHRIEIFQVKVDERSAEELADELQQKYLPINYNIISYLHNYKAYQESIKPGDYRFVKVSTTDLGFEERATFDALRETARKYGARVSEHSLGPWFGLFYSSKEPPALFASDRLNDEEQNCRDLFVIDDDLTQPDQHYRLSVSSYPLDYKFEYQKFVFQVEPKPITPVSSDQRYWDRQDELETNMRK